MKGFAALFFSILIMIFKFGLISKWNIIWKRRIKTFQNSYWNVSH